MDNASRDDLVRGLFAQMTCKLEDAAELAAQGQDPAAENRIELADQIVRLAEATVIIAQATAELLRLSREQP